MALVGLGLIVWTKISDRRLNSQCCPDMVILTVAEHHSALVPWQFVDQKTGAVLKFVSLTEDEVPDVENLRGILTRQTKLFVVHHVSNVLASVLPIDQIVVSWANDVGAKVLVDACQSVPPSRELSSTWRKGMVLFHSKGSKVSEWKPAQAIDRTDRLLEGDWS